MQEQQQQQQAAITADQPLSDSVDAQGTSGSPIFELFYYLPRILNNEKRFKKILKIVIKKSKTNKFIR